VITFDETGFKRQGAKDGVLLWRTPHGDGMGLFHYAVPPDIHADLSDVEGLRAFYRKSLRDSGLDVLEVDTVAVDGCTAVRTLFKRTHEPTHLGGLTFPFRDFSYVLRLQCDERGIEPPLSRLRWVLDHLERTIAIDAAVKAQPGFAWKG
jgi:hypothetical protein